jgi:hypothetical protein
LTLYKLVMEHVYAKKLWMDWWKTIKLNGLYLP